MTSGKYSRKKKAKGRRSGTGERTSLILVNEGFHGEKQRIDYIGTFYFTHYYNERRFKELSERKQIKRTKPRQTEKTTYSEGAGR